MFVYKITNKKNGMAYIGATETDVATRWERHLRHSGGAKVKQAIHRAIASCGRESFVVEPLYEATSRDELLVAERGAIAAHGTFRPNGYNETSGGLGVRGCHPSAETRAKLVENWSLTDDGKRRISAANCGDGNGCAKLTRAQVIEIRALLGTMKQYEIAAQFGVSGTAISRIARGIRWAKVF